MVITLPCHTVLFQLHPCTLCNIHSSKIEVTNIYGAQCDIYIVLHGVKMQQLKHYKRQDTQRQNL
jgi:hypothetical protein